MFGNWLSRYAHRHPSGTTHKRRTARHPLATRRRARFESLDDRTVLSAVALASIAPELQPDPLAAAIEQPPLVADFNQPPSGTDNSITMDGLSYTFSPDDFGFSDPGDVPPDQFDGIVLTTLPQRGLLRAFGSGVARGQFIEFEDLFSGELEFSASVADQVGYGSFTFQVRDTGGTLDGGFDIDPTPNTMTLFFDDAPNNFMRGLYSDVLNRAPEATGLTAWLDTLAAGTSRAEVALAMWETTEHRAMQVDEYYERFLNRDPDSAGLQNWINQFQAGVDEATMMALFMTTDEYLQNNSSNEVFVVQAYRDVLFREPDLMGQDFWVTGLENQILTRADVAAGLIDTVERHSNLVDLYYQDFFNREPDSLGEAAWTDALDQNLLDDQGVAVALLSTIEYFNMPR